MWYPRCLSLGLGRAAENPGWRCLTVSVNECPEFRMGLEICLFPGPRKKQEHLDERNVGTQTASRAEVQVQVQGPQGLSGLLRTLPSQQVLAALTPWLEQPFPPHVPSSSQLAARQPETMQPRMAVYKHESSAWFQNP